MNAMQRIGDAERDVAIESLREHASAGRLTLDEFGERMTKALQARIQADLTVLFEDLPGGAPGRHRAELSPQPLTDAKAVGVALRPFEWWQLSLTAVIWVAFFAAVVFGAMSWWMFWLPMVITGGLAEDRQKREKKRKQIEG